MMRGGSPLGSDERESARPGIALAVIVIVIVIVFVIAPVMVAALVTRERHRGVDRHRERDQRSRLASNPTCDADDAERGFVVHGVDQDQGFVPESRARPPSRARSRSRT